MKQPKLRIRLFDSRLALFRRLFGATAVSDLRFDLVSIRTSTFEFVVGCATSRVRRLVAVTMVGLLPIAFSGEVEFVWEGFERDLLDDGR